MKFSTLLKCSTYFLACQLMYTPMHASTYIDIHDNLERIATQIEPLCEAHHRPLGHDAQNHGHSLCEIEHHTNSIFCQQACSFGNALFRAFAPDQWYSIRVPIVPDTTLLSRKRASGFSQGDICLRPNGVAVNKGGSYSVNFSAILQNPNTCNTLILPIFLAINGQVDSAGIENLAVLPAGSVVAVSASGILPNVEAGAHLTIRIGNSPNAAKDHTPIRIVSWDINLSEIPCSVN